MEVALKSFDSLYLSLSIYEVATPKAVIQIIHGLRDHKNRYQELIQWLNANNYNVVISDLRGHGRSINNNYPLGYFENINELIEDQKVINNFIKNKYSNLPIFMFSHNFGTVISRLYLKKYAMDINKLVLSGPIAYNEEINMGLSVGKVLTKVNGKAKSSDTLKSYVNLDKDDYICNNPPVMEELKNDPLCMISYCNQSLMVVLEGRKELHDLKKIESPNPDLKILCISGENDINVEIPNGLNDTITYLQKMGYKNIDNLIYSKMASETFHENGKEQVFYDVIRFFNN